MIILRKCNKLLHRDKVITIGGFSCNTTMSKKVSLLELAAADDDSENDSDYNPDNDPDAEDDDNKHMKQSEENTIQEMSYSRKRKVDELWSSLLETEKKTIVEHKEKIGTLLLVSGKNEQSIKDTKKQRKTKQQKKKNLSILSEIFGKADAKKIVDSAYGDLSSLNDTTVTTDVENTSKKSKSNETSEEIKARVREAVSKIQKKTQVVEKRKFAGQEIE